MSMHNSGRNDTKNPGGSVGYDDINTAHFDDRPEKTLGDYIARRYTHEAFDKIAEEVGLKRPSKKLTFDEWWSKHKSDDPCFRLKQEEVFVIWKAAQENV